MGVNFLKQNGIIYQMSVEDKNNPEIYNELYKLIKQMLLTKKLKINDKDIDEISYTMAGDMYLKIIDGNFFKHPTNYIEKTYRRYIDIQCNPKDLIDVDTVSSMLLEKEYFSSFTEDLNNTIIRVYLEDIQILIKQLLTECPIKEDTIDYMNFKVSIILSLLYGDIRLYHLDRSYKPYVKVFTINFYEKIKADYQ